jgi:ankyrin repeat protein
MSKHQEKLTCPHCGTTFKAGRHVGKEARCHRCKRTFKVRHHAEAGAADPQGDVNAKDAQGQTLLHHAAERGDAVLAQQVLGKGAEVDAQDKNGQTPLHLAAGKGQAALAKLLLGQGADVNATDKTFGRTALHCAAGRGDRDMVELLLKAGADAAAADKFGDGALKEALARNHGDIADLLKAHGASA